MSAEETIEKHSDSSGLFSRGIWSALLLGALVGLLLWFVLTGVQFALLSVLGYPATLPPILVRLSLLLPIPVWLATGIISHLRLVRMGWVPRLTWLLLAFLALPAVPLGTSLGGALLGALLATLSLRETPGASQVMLFISPIFGFGIWLILARLAVRVVTAPPKVGAKHPLLAIVSMSFLMLFVFASWLPGMGTLMLGSAIGLPVMIGLALFGMSGHAPENRTPTLIMTLWLIPVLTLIGVTILFFLEL